jgi:nucleotide-binding universal stress UspA family protein
MTITHLLVPSDGSEHADRAVDLAGDIAGRYGARLTLLHVLSHDTAGRRIAELKRYAESEHLNLTDAQLVRRAAGDLLERAEERARRAGAKDVTLVAEEGDPARVIAEHAELHKVDLIVMGRRGLGGLEGLLLGSVSHKVAQLAPCACLTVR